MKSLQLVVVAAFAFSLLETGAPQCDVLRVVGAMYETLGPLLTEMKQELASVKTELREGLAQVKENLTNIQQQVNALTETVSNMEQNSNDEQTTGLHTKLDMVKSLLVSVNSSMSEGLSGVKTELQEHSGQTASELAGLETNQETIDSKLDSLDSKQDGLSMTVTTAHSELEQNVLTNVTKELKKTADYILEQLPPYECGVVRLAAAVYETLSPFMTEMKQELAFVKTELREGLAKVNENLTNIQKQVNSASNMEQNSNDEQTTGLHIQLDMVKSLLVSVNISMSEGLSAVNTSMSEGLSGVKAKLQEHSSQTASELAGLETNQETIDSKLDSLDSKQDGLSMTVMTAHSELERNVLTNVTKELKKTADYILEQLPPYECGVVRLAAAVYETLSPFMTEMRDGLAAVKENMTSVQEQINSLTETVAKELEQNLLTNVTKELKKTADFILEHVYECGGIGGWRRVVYLNMTDTNANFSVFGEISDGGEMVRVCQW
ncbi:hypothetical protein GBAR_LOCUS29787 [Geodia barretti]|uniref:Uncharacterized protein n=1 Tax=Geodia barretti TaxID=519541 RepID=A0AA35TUA7_GEOBA|nr:hypothetical protein GBAR_LOCUS29787 [Geodia barretti]